MIVNHEAFGKSKIDLYNKKTDRNMYVLNLTKPKFISSSN